MTATKKENAVVSNNRNIVFVLNIGLVVATAVFFILYIIKINRITDLRYGVGLLKVGLAKENLLTQNYLDEQQQSIQGLISFARARGMIEVKNYDSFFEESGVALK